MLCSGQSSSTRRSSGSTFSAVLFEETIALHMVTATLQAQNSVSVGFWPQQYGLAAAGSSAGHQLCLCPLPLCSSTQPDCSVSSRQPSDGALRGRERAWQQGLRPTCHDWEAKASEWLKIFLFQSPHIGQFSLGALFPLPLPKPLWPFRLRNSEPSRPVGLVPVTCWGTAQ